MRTEQSLIVQGLAGEGPATDVGMCEFILFYLLRLTLSHTSSLTSLSL